MALGEGFTCVKTSDGGVWCWGDNIYHQLGTGTVTQESAPVQVLDADSDLGAGGAGPLPLQGVTALVAGTLHACALGVDQFSIYLQHDAKDETLRAYGEKVMPAIADAVKAKS